MRLSPNEWPNVGLGATRLLCLYVKVLYIYIYNTWANIYLYIYNIYIYKSLTHNPKVYDFTNWLNKNLNQCILMSL